MRKILFLGHTGSDNRGCEAIIRSSIELLKTKNIESDLASFAKYQDVNLGIDKLCGIIEYKSVVKNPIIRIYYAVLRRIFKNNDATQKYIQSNIIKKINDYSALLIIGGDTYCYSKPVYAYFINKYAKNKNVKTIFWGCSIGKEFIDKEMIEDLNRYSLIFPREIITYNNLISAGIEKSKLFLMCDSAFALKKKEIELPMDFNFENSLVYNPSFTLNRKEKNDLLEKNRYKLVEYILDKTDMNIVFLPHVYADNYGDVVTARNLYEKYKNSNRVLLIDGNYNSMELKYIISKCRFLIAERTHASIAGYSSLVPTFVIGYSVKSIGIAKDLFETDENYVVSAKELKNEDDLLNKFKYIMDNEQQIKDRLAEVMPSYSQRAFQAIVMLENTLFDCKEDK